MHFDIKEHYKGKEVGDFTQLRIEMVIFDLKTQLSQNWRWKNYMSS